MLNQNQSPAADITADYWRAYFEWRSTYGLRDDCMRELLAAIRVEAESPIIEPEQKTGLDALARMIETELECEMTASRAA